DDSNYYAVSPRTHSETARGLERSAAGLPRDRQRPELLVENGGASVRVEIGGSAGELLLTADRSFDDFSAFVMGPETAGPRFVGNVRLSAWYQRPSWPTPAGYPRR